jgi:hypothetical protein
LSLFFPDRVELRGEMEPKIHSLGKLMLDRAKVSGKYAQERAL